MIPKQRWLQNLALTLPFLLLFWVDLAHHQLWRDELNAWAIALASPTLPRLFFYVHYEGHPWLWYFLLWLPSRVLHTPNAMKAVEALIGTAIYLILGLTSPFTRLQKILIFSGYFLVFEYTVMSRMYSLMFLAALLYVLLRTRRPNATIGALALLGLIANTDTAGILLSGALLLEYAYTWYTTHRHPSSPQKRTAILALLLYLAMLAFSVHTLTPAHDISWQASGRLGAEMFERHHVAESIGNLVAAPWWPISPLWPRHFWDTNSMANKKILLLVPFVLAAYWSIFRRSRNLQLLMALILAEGILFADIIYPGHIRNWGIVFVAFLVALWLQQASSSSPQTDRPSRWSYALLALSALAGIFAVAGSWTRPFSQAGTAAAWVTANEPATLPVVADWDFIAADIGEQLQRPVYFLSCACVDTFRLFRRDREEFYGHGLPTRLNRAMDDLHTTQLLLATYNPLTPESREQLRQASLIVTPLVTFDGSEGDHEDFYINTVVRRPQQ